MRAPILLLFIVQHCLTEYLISNNGPCTCDLTASFCDTNCCCDTFCTSQQINSFTCSNLFISPTSYGCIPTEILFSNNTSFNTSNNGTQICIFDDNYSARNFFTAPNFTNDTLISADTATPPVKYSSFDPQSVFNSTNTYGSLIFTVENNVSVGYLTTARPSSSGGACVDGQAIKYLVNESTLCSRTCSSSQSIDNYYKSSLLIAASPVNLLYSFNNISDWTKNNFFVTPNITCNNSACSNTIAIVSNTSCSNVVVAVKISITVDVNITAVNMDLTVGNVEGTSYIQAWTVGFINSAFNPSADQYSGNPGYLIDKPVRTAFSNSTISFWKIPSTTSCSTPSNSNLLFGVNVETDCLISGNGSALTSSQINATLSSLLPQFVAPYGNSVAPVTDWVPVSLTYSGTGANKQSIYFLYARNGTLTLPQNKIIGVLVNGDYSTANNDSYVTISVTFVDVSQTAFDVNSAVNRLRSGRSVREFLYLFYVDNQATSLLQIRKVYLIIAVVVAVAGPLLNLF